MTQSSIEIIPKQKTNLLAGKQIPVWVAQSFIRPVLALPVGKKELSECINIIQVSLGPTQQKRSSNWILKELKDHFTTNIGFRYSA